VITQACVYTEYDECITLVKPVLHYKYTALQEPMLCVQVDQVDHWHLIHANSMKCADGGRESVGSDRLFFTVILPFNWCFTTLFVYIIII